MASDGALAPIKLQNTSGGKQVWRLCSICASVCWIKAKSEIKPRLVSHFIFKNRPVEADIINPSITVCVTTSDFEVT